MARTTKPANGSPDSPKPRRSTKKGNGSTAHHNGDPNAVARRAYEIFLSRGGGHGSDVEDWLEAERQVKQGSTKVMASVAPKPRKRKSSEGTGP
jgi:hypothetical protein